MLLHKVVIYFKWRSQWFIGVYQYQASWLVSTALDSFKFAMICSTSTYMKRNFNYEVLIGDVTVCCIYIAYVFRLYSTNLLAIFLMKILNNRRWHGSII